MKRLGISEQFIIIYLWQHHLIYYNVFNNITIYDNVALALIAQAEIATICIYLLVLFNNTVISAA